MKLKQCLFALILCLCTFTNLFSQSKNHEKIFRVSNQLNTWNVDDIHIRRLGGGQTNDNYKVSSGPISYFFRCSNGSNSILGCSLEREWKITNLVAESNIAPQIIFYAPEEGILVTDFIETSGAKVNLRDKTTMHKFCHMISSVHNLQVEFPTQFCPFESIQDFIKNSSEVGVVLPITLEVSVLQWVNELKKSQLSTKQTDKKPAHLDLWSGNILDDGKKLWLIDWEYAANADPFFDLATLTSVENFSNDEMYELLECYLEREPNQEEMSHFICMRVLADTRWALWAFLQGKISPLDVPFEEIGNQFLQHALNRIN